MAKYKIKKLITEAPHGIHVQHAYAKRKKSSGKLLVMLPGRTYMIEGAVLHYLRMVALDLGFDVLSVRYSFMASPEKVSRSDLDREALTAECMQAIEQVSQDEDYRQVVVAAQAGATPLAPLVAQQIGEHVLRLIMLTPVDDAVLLAREFRTLAIIGSEDPEYKPDAVRADSSYPNISWYVFDGLDRSLEPVDWRSALVTLTEMMTLCEDFLDYDF